MSNLKEIIKLLPNVVEGRELTLTRDKLSRMWYVGHPTLDGDFSVGLYGWDEDIEGAALSLLSQFDKNSKAPDLSSEHKTKAQASQSGPSLPEGEE